MNNAQLVSIVSKLIVAACAAVAAKYGFSLDGAGIAATVAPIIVGLLATLWAHWFHSGTDTTASGSKNVVGVLVMFVCLAALLFCSGGCSLTTQKMTIVTPAVYEVNTNSAGLLQSNLVSAASVKTVTDKQRLWLPEGYALMIEDDMFGMTVEMSSPSSTYPNVKVGEHHGSSRWIPTSTNHLYAADMVVDGSIDNKAVPFRISSKGTFTAGHTMVSQTTDTNGATSTASSSIVPGTPTTQAK